MKLMRLGLVVLFILVAVPAVAESRAESSAIQMPEISDYQRAAQGRLTLQVAIQEDELVKIKRRMQTLRACIGLMADRIYQVLVLIVDDPTVSPELRSAASGAIEMCLYVLNVLGLL